MTRNRIKFFAVLLLSCISFQQFYAQNHKPKKVNLSSVYNFDYHYKLNMITQNGDVTLDYFLKKDADYFGFKMAQKNTSDGDMFFVMDTKLELTAMFMDMMGQKIVQTSKLNAAKEEVERTAIKKEDFTTHKIDKKTLLGFECQGYMTENANYEIIYYLTDKIPVNFSQIWSANTKQAPKGFNLEWMNYADKGLILEMTYKDKLDPTNDMVIGCLALEATDEHIDTESYKSMAYGG